MALKKQLFIGLMSGTSMDGIDAALVDVESNHCIHGITYQYSDYLKYQLQEAMSLKAHSLAWFSQLNRLAGQEFAKAAIELLKQSGVASHDVVAIGSHGQTLCHDTSVNIPYTVQYGCAHTISHMTGMTVVADFRTRDLIAGGQGAPFAPIYHQELFQHQKSALAVVNIGGIANLSYLQKNKPVSGYDTGPGNCLMDAWIAKHLGKNFDRDGRWAAMGEIIPSLLNDLVNDIYFQRQAPKSIGKEYFSLTWLEGYLSDNYQPCDVQATLKQLTAVTIADSINSLPALPKYLLICGGGVHNQALMASLKELLPDIEVLSTERFRVNPDFIEAMMFAWLAKKALDYMPLDMQHITGAQYPVILGAIYPGKNNAQGD